MRPAILAITILLAHFGLSIGGCATSSPGMDDADPLGGAPRDLTIDVTILTGTPRTRDPREPAPPPVELSRRQSRYIVFADGSLHYGADERRGADWRPGFVRRLDRAQMSDLWLLLRQIDLDEPSAGDPPRNAALMEPTNDAVVHIVAIRARGERWMVAREMATDAETAPAVTQLIRRLAELAWVSETVDERVLVIPERYDFGPDPYARYRD